MDNLLKAKQLSVEIDRLRVLFNNDFRAAMDQLVPLIDKYTSSTGLRLRALLLASRVTDYFETYKVLDDIDEYERWLVSADEILVELERIQGSEESQPTDYRDIRDFFIARKTDAVVFSGKNIGRKQGDFEIKPISFELKLGEITSVVGKNGNGKSSLLKMVAGESPIHYGKYDYPEFSPSILDWKKIKRQIGYIPQQLGLEFSSSRKTYLHFAAAVKKIKGKSNDEAVEYILTRLGLKKFQDYPWAKLSGGYQLRFELARQLIWNPQLIIMDEPLAHLDVMTRQIFLADLRNLTNSLRYPLAVMISSQNLYELENISDNVIFLNNGEALYNGEVSQISGVTKKNGYLINTDNKITDLRSALDELGSHILDIKSDYNEFIISTTPEINGNQLMTALLKANITISNFRNISNSTRIFFENEDTSA